VAALMLFLQGAARYIRDILFLVKNRSSQ
jgi:hypothetical protein